MLAYSIDELRASSGDPAKLLFSLWDIWREADANDALLPEERIIRDAWIYDTGNGNGFWDMLVNERYDEIAAGLDALRQFSSRELDLYVESIAAAFRRFGSDCFDSESIQAAHHRGEPPREVLEAAEETFLHRLWYGAIIEAAHNYIERHIEVFRTRQAMA
jgi:hypothetical protein